MRLFEQVFTSLIRQGELRIIDADGRAFDFGTREAGRARVAVRFTDNHLLDQLITSPSMIAGEAYMDGRMLMEEGDVLDLLDLFTSNTRYETRSGDTLWKKAIRTGRKLNPWAPGNPLHRARSNVAHHYDLSAELYDLFLDADRQYSCAYFTDRDNSLEQAQADKKAHIAAKLMLGPGQTVLDIGCGWGGLALYLHAATGADVLGITLSKEQLKIAQKRAISAGVAEHVRFELVDYRTVEGRFDRIVSVGMFEHVGPAHHREFFKRCRALLADDGVALIHTIGRIGTRRPTDPWTTKYIFPGGYIPTLSEIAEAVERERLIIGDVEALRLHYAYTLEHWLRRAQARQADIEALYDARFYRMWEFYLASSLTGFTNGQMLNYQVQLIRDRTALPLTRDYMGLAERTLKR